MFYYMNNIYKLPNVILLLYMLPTIDLLPLNNVGYIFF